MHTYIHYTTSITRLNGLPIHRSEGTSLRFGSSEEMKTMILMKSIRIRPELPEVRFEVIYIDLYVKINQNMASAARMIVIDF